MKTVILQQFLNMWSETKYGCRLGKREGLKTQNQKDGFLVKDCK